MPFYRLSMNFALFIECKVLKNNIFPTKINLSSLILNYLLIFLDIFRKFSMKMKINCLKGLNPLWICLSKSDPGLIWSCSAFLQKKSIDNSIQKVNVNNLSKLHSEWQCSRYTHWQWPFCVQQCSDIHWQWPLCVKQCSMNTHQQCPICMQ